MKKYILVSALTAITVIGALLATAYFFGWHTNTVKVEHVNDLPVKGAMYTLNDDGEVIPLDFTKTASKVMDAVVHIKSTQAMDPRVARRSNPMDDYFGDDLFERFFGPQYRSQSPNQQPQEPEMRVGTGSGVVIQPDGYIVTNNHVIAEATDIEVTLHDNRSYKAKLIGMDPTTDLALLKIDVGNLPSLALVNSDAVQVGEWVMAVGNPFNLNSTVTAGIVSAKGRNINILREQFAVESFIQTDAAINPGNSGGALVNLEGNLIGINTAIASPTGSYSGYGFAIPSNIVSKVIEDLLEFGTVQRGFIGAMIRSVDQSLASEKGLERVQGVYVDSLVSDGGAEAAGIKPGDIITSIDGNTVNNSSALLETIARHRPGDKLNLTVDRKGTMKNFVVTLNNKNGDTSRVVKESPKKVESLLGAELAAVSSSTARKLDIQGGVQIKKLLPGVLRKQTTIQEGFIILRVNGKAVKDPEDLENRLNGNQGGVMLEGMYESKPGETYYYAFGL
ncbi:MAG: Do family serine endopeptidase [Saprospiraceae bacterium]|nr:Do family serine endopeptidase [Saprospiraceae bacterium]